MVETAPQVSGTPPRRRSAGVVLVASGLALFVVELVAVLTVRAPYDLALQAVSDLGASRCGPLDTYDPPVEVCSPAAAFLNGTWVLTGVLVAVAAWVLRPRATGTAGTLSVLLLAVAALAQAGVGLLPVDEALEPHLLVALGGFLAQLVGLLLLGVALGRVADSRGYATVVLGLGVVTAVAAGLLVVTTAGLLHLPLGLVERAVIYPFQVWMVVHGLRALAPATPATPAVPAGQ
ncbi:DUF998 domain-containing protein [Nocardioides zeae]|uniref:DUF998 domain-containing protein n=1 Tax=Nocardioides imazamoxiresistens TaxID=3231893 RepID=A0ABU3PRW4_9ACTN|nr:DUF998 domain-containing protein [Nocardioides zeae]MDT9591969.1 DUF998 domain-containing protein [Nocardioides zeae]